MFSTPLICCSIGVTTVAATTSALAPGYWPVTLITGGAISGYCATGRRENLLDLSLVDESVDYVLCWGVLMHIPAIDEAIAQLDVVEPVEDKEAPARRDPPDLTLVRPEHPPRQAAETPLSDRSAHLLDAHVGKCDAQPLGVTGNHVEPLDRLMRERILVADRDRATGAERLRGRLEEGVEPAFGELGRLQRRPDAFLLDVEDLVVEPCGELVGIHIARAERERINATMRLPFRQAAPKIGFQAGGGLVPLLRVLGEEFHDDGRHRLGNSSAIARRCWLACSTPSASGDGSGC